MPCGGVLGPEGLADDRADGVPSEVIPPRFFRTFRALRAGGLAGSSLDALGVELSRMKFGRNRTEPPTDVAGAPWSESEM